MFSERKMWIINYKLKFEVAVTELMVCRLLMKLRFLWAEKWAGNLELSFGQGKERNMGEQI